MHTTLCNLPRPGMFCVQNAIHAHRLLGWNKTVILCYHGLQSALLLPYFSANPISTFVAVWKPQNKSILNLLNTKSMTLFKLQLSQQNDNTFAKQINHNRYTHNNWMQLNLFWYCRIHFLRGEVGVHYMKHYFIELYKHCYCKVSMETFQTVIWKGLKC